MNKHSLKKATDKTIYLGIELEAAYPNHLFNRSSLDPYKQNRHYKTNESPEDFMRRVAGSITEGTNNFFGDGRDGGGIEIRTEPATFGWLMSNREVFDRMFTTFIKEKFISRNHCSGMHIHICKKAFTPESFCQLIKFFKQNREFIFAISDRGLRCSEYADIEHDRTYMTSNLIDYVKPAFKEGGGTIGGNVLAVNRKGYPTIEFRIFNGTLEKNKFFANIQFVYSLYKFITSLEEDESNTLQNYINFVFSKKVMFKELVNNFKSIQEILVEDLLIQIK